MGRSENDIGNVRAFYPSQLSFRLDRTRSLRYSHLFQCHSLSSLCTRGSNTRVRIWSEDIDRTRIATVTGRRPSHSSSQNANLEHWSERSKSRSKSTYQAAMRRPQVVPRLGTEQITLISNLVQNYCFRQSAKIALIAGSTRSTKESPVIFSRALPNPYQQRVYAANAKMPTTARSIGMSATRCAASDKRALNTSFPKNLSRLWRLIFFSLAFFCLIPS